MTHPEGEFGDFESDFQTTEKAQAGASIGIVPEGTYKVACCQQDLTGAGVLVDHEIFEAKSKTKGFKLFLEILEPVEMLDPAISEKVKTQGEVIEQVFWVTQKNLGYLKRDIATILGRDLKNLNELTQITWVGKTCEIGIKHETYKGFKQNRIIFFNAWTPESGSGKKETAPAAAATTAPAASAAPPKEPQGDPEF